jgi:hypothetical protein
VVREDIEDVNRRHPVRAPQRRKMPALPGLMFWGTASPEHLIPQNDWAGEFGPSITVIHPSPTSTAFFGNTDFTVATWVRPTNIAASTLQIPYSQWNWNGNERKFYLFNDTTNNRAGFAVFGTLASGAGASAAVTTQGGLGRMVDRSWYRLVGIHRRGVDITFYLNNQLVGTTLWTAGVNPGTGPNPQQPWIGGISRGGINYDMNQYWRGQIGPTCYSTRVWSPEEVAWDYNGGRGRRYAELGEPGTHGENLLTDLVAFWQMTEEDTGTGPYIVRRDSHTGGHHLTNLQHTHPGSAPGVLAKLEPVADDERVHQLTDRSPRGNSIVQPDQALRPFWDAESEVISIEAGNVFVNPGLTGLDGRALSLYLVSVLEDSTEAEPWLHVSEGGMENSGVKIYRDGSTLRVRAWIGGGLRELTCGLSYPAERLLEVHYDGRQVSVWENGRMNAFAPCPGGFDHPLTQLALGPVQGFKELLIYNEAHQ